MIQVLRIFSAFLLLIVFASFSAQAKDSEENEFSFVDYYKGGNEAYKQEKWLSCIGYFTKTIEEFRIYKKKLISCRRTCHAAVNEGDFITKRNDTENRFYENALKNTLCLLRCKNAQFGNQQTIYYPGVEEALEDLVAYDYLQMCYFKAGMIDKALTAAYTFLMGNPGHENMQHNIKFYLEEFSKKVSQKDLHNIEAKSYQEAYIHGIEAAESKNYQNLMDQMETSLDNYIEEEENCRVMCEGPFDQDGMQPDFYIAMANHLTYAMKCRRKCVTRLQRFHGFSEKTPMMNRYYYYLAVAYENLREPEKTCQALASFLLFNPDDEEMLKKKEELLTFDDVEADWFVPRTEAVKYFNVHHSENKLFDFMEKEFEIYLEEEAERKPKDKNTAVKGENIKTGGKHEKDESASKKIKPSQSGEKKNSETVVKSDENDSTM